MKNYPFYPFLPGALTPKWSDSEDQIKLLIYCTLPHSVLNKTELRNLTFHSHFSMLAFHFSMLAFILYICMFLVLFILFNVISFQTRLSTTYIFNCFTETKWMPFEKLQGFCEVSKVPH